MNKVSELINETMEKMQEHGFTQGEANSFVRMFKRRMRENSKQIEESKPFTVFHYKN